MLFGDTDKYSVITVEFSILPENVMFLSIITMNSRCVSASASLLLARNILLVCTAAFCHEKRPGPQALRRAIGVSCWFCSWCGLSAYDFNLIIFIFVFDLLCFLLSVRLFKATHLLQAPTEPGLVENNTGSARHLGEGGGEGKQKANGKLLLGCQGGQNFCIPSELICRTKLQKSLFLYDSHSRISAPLQAGGEGAECHP